MSNCQIYELRKNELHISTGDVVGIPKCQISSLASDPNGLCILHSRNSEKDYTIFDEALREKLYQEDYDLREIIFPAQVSFENYIFKQEVDFSSAKFLDEAIFIKAKFLDEAIFIKAKFLKDAFFSEVEFLGFSNFFGAEFAGEANLCARFNNGASFNSTTFKGCTEFTEAEFDSGVQFMGARFYDDVDFSWTKFSSNVIFDAAEFHGAVIFDSINFSSEGEPKYTHFYGEFTYLKFGPKAIFQFKDCSLAFVQFEGTDLRCIIFKNVIWYQYGYHRRSAIYDEILLKEKSNKLRREDYARIEESYRYLKLNYGREGD